MILNTIKDIKTNFSSQPLTIETDDVAANIIDQYNQMKLGHEAFYEKVNIGNESLKKYFATVDAGKASLTGYQTYVETTNKSVGKLGIATKAASVGTKLLGVAMSALTSIGISIAISAIVSGIDHIIRKEEILREKSEEAKKTIDELTESFKTQKETVSEVKQRYAELAQGVDQLSGKNISLSNSEYEEFLSISNKLGDLFPQLTRNYTENGDKLLNLKGDVDSIVFSLDELIKRQSDLTKQQMLDEMPSIYENYENTVTKYTQKLEEAKQKQKDYLTLYNQLKNATYDVSDDKKIVTFHLGNIDETDKSKLTEELTSSFEDLNDYVVQDFGALDNHDTSITLYLDKEFDGFEARLKSAQDEIGEYTSKIESEVGSFSTYMNNWLQGSWIYQQQDADMQSALKQVLFNKDWIEVAKEKLGEDAGFDEVSKWIETNYINAISSINDEEIKKDFIDLFTLNLTPQATIDLAQKLQDYFKEHDILVSLDFILDGEDPNSEQNLVNRFQSSLTDIAGGDIKAANKLATYTSGFDETQMNMWLEATKDAANAGDAINKYQYAVNEAAKASKQNVNFFTDDNVENIDAYKDKISNLGTFLESINSDHKLTAEEITILNTTYGIVANSVEEYKQAIIDLMNQTATSSEIMTALKDAIANCNDEASKTRLQSLYDTLQNVNVEAQNNADSFGNLDTAISDLQSKAETLRTINKEMREVGHIDSSQLNDILSAYPELENAVVEYNAGLISSQELFDALEECYNEDRKKYAHLIADKLQYNEEFYDNLVADLPEWIIKLADTYKIDFKNFKNLCDAKLALQKELVAKQAKLDIARTIVDNLHDDDPSNDSMYMTLMDATNDEFDPSKNLVESKKQLSDIEAIIKGLDTTLETNLDLDTSWQKYGSETTNIDWIDQSLTVLQEAVDDAQTALDNTHGFDAQITAIDTLNDALTKLKDGYQEAQGEYSDRYTEYLSQIPDSDTIRGYIESGTEFDLSPYDAATAEIIQKAIDAYNKMVEAEDKIAELDKQIDNNNKIEKSKIRQAKYETKLSGVQTELSNPNLTADEKNDLLKQQLDYQNKINKELIEQAENEGRILDAENLRKENKQNELDKINGYWQNKIDENQNSIDAKNALLESDSLTESEIDDIYSELEDLTETDYKNKFKQIIKQLDVDNKWTGYITDLKKKYGQEDVNTKKFVQEHMQEIIEHFSYTGMESLYYEFLNSMDDFDDQGYETSSTTRSYYINNNNNKIANIQSDIDYAGGRGTEEQYVTMQALHQENLGIWTEQKKEAQTFLDAQTEGTAGWDYWNAKLQECDENIKSCERSVKDCNIEILKLPLNDIEDELKDIDNQLYDINESIDDYNTYISAANYILDTQLKTQNNLKESVQDEIDKLEKANDLRKSNLALQKAEYELEKLRNQKTEKVFHEGQGFVYESNVDDVKSAQEAYDSAVYDNQIASMNDQIKSYDLEIKRLNKIKDKWSDIATNAQGEVDLNKAKDYDPDFYNKVLIGDTSIIDDIQTNMNGLYSEKDSLEEKQKSYQRLQDLINDTIEKYQLEAISYELASQQISTSIQTYFPELAGKYNFESGKLQEIIDKKNADADTTKTSSEKINETLSESNKKILENYTKFQEELGKIFEGLNTMLQTYVDNTNAMATAIGTAVSTIQSQINSIANLSASVSITSSTNTDESSANKGKGKNGKGDGIVRNHSGLELGYIGESSISKDKEAFKYLALNELKDDELLRIVQKGEAILNVPQVTQVMDNFRKLTQVKVPNITPNAVQTNHSVNFNGNIVLNNPVGDSSKLANEIKQNLGSKLLQELYKK